eukprot:973345-Pyramimonas_sp.AAC.1
MRWRLSFLFRTTCGSSGRPFGSKESLLWVGRIGMSFLSCTASLKSRLGCRRRCPTLPSCSGVSRKAPGARSFSPTAVDWPARVPRRRGAAGVWLRLRRMAGPSER